MSVSTFEETDLLVLLALLASKRPKAQSLGQS